VLQHIFREVNAVSYYKGLSLEGKRALVFGGTSGLGKAIALGLAEAGADIVPASRHADKVRETVTEVRTLGRRALALTADVTHREEIQRVIDAMRKELGRIDILVNSAGATKRVPSLEMADVDWNRILDVNLNGTWYACQMVGAVMKGQGYGRIINICSLGSFVSIHEVAAYCAGKAAVAELTRCLAAEWAKYGIAVNGIAPGYFETPLSGPMLSDPRRKGAVMTHTPMLRLGNLEEIKGAAIFLASDSASFVTGEILRVDGGFMAQGVGDGVFA
jgi:NAD(P)-dependent dehydrogenase (short-subunit alcohol dehydrogenase family)